VVVKVSWNRTHVVPPLCESSAPEKSVKWSHTPHVQGILHLPFLFSHFRRHSTEQNSSPHLPYIAGTLRVQWHQQHRLWYIRFSPCNQFPWRVKPDLVNGLCYLARRLRLKQTMPSTVLDNVHQNHIARWDFARTPMYFRTSVMPVFVFVLGLFLASHPKSLLRHDR